MSAGLVCAGAVLWVALVVRRAQCHLATTAVRRRLGGRPRPGGRPVPRWFAARLRMAGVAEPAGWWRAGLVAGPMACVLLWSVFGPVAAALAVAGLAVVPVAIRRWASTRDFRRRDAALPAMLEDVAGALRSGRSLRQALVIAAERSGGPLAVELRGVVTAVERGGSIAGELEAWAGKVPSEGLRLAVIALVLGAESGGRQARALEGVAATLRDRRSVDRELRALTASARASAAVMGVAPVAFAAFAASADRRTAEFLLGSPSGLACLAAGLVLDGVAAVWMLRLTGAAR